MRVAGVDEAGRGALAGPVVAAAVFVDEKLNLKNQTCFENIKDSKQLTDSQRRACSVWIMEHGVWGLGVVDADEIDQFGIKKATEKAMNIAVAVLQENAEIEALEVDGRDGFRFPLPSTDIIKGDEKVLAISAASILAKVHRDDLMIAFDADFPEFGFAQHKGYGAADHLTKLKAGEYSEIHRKTYEPLRTFLSQHQFEF